MGKNWFPLARKFASTSQNEKKQKREKKLSLGGMSKKYIKNGFHWPENPFPLIEMQELFKNKFQLDGKIKLSVAGVSENGRKKMVSTKQKISFQ